ncbi:MAG: hypothetical protein A3I05_04070 [Deltaproteobacteria bacterium RIFCSPLOWO2_02_FULL_44_10]|nr:MAG: hypothetical protein A3C46_03780 [Deltaproteobacteria bacterium RIFCSPHIGHO2_02_FULL_44_16]OGQ46322.1 MAG: hypothetical protein A3I05_04070 [Deltaproteobacteria bacterium RIFCSPLOWO2_02_FULL_44_10]
MKNLKDYKGNTVRLTDERLAHILEHPEMANMATAIQETLLHPEIIVQSSSDETANLYYRYYSKTMVGEKYLCVIVKVQKDDAFILTAYLTDKIKKGKILWKAN